MIFRSKYSKLKVSFPPTLFGTTEDTFGKKVAHKGLKFDSGFVKVEDDHIIEFMRKHSGNELNGGSEFWEEEEGVTGLVNAVYSNKPFIGNKLAEDKPLLDELTRWVSKQFSPTQRDKVCDTLEKIVGVYKISNFTLPKPDQKSRTIKAKAVELLDFLEEEGLFTEEVNEGQGHLEGSEVSN